FHHRAHQSTSCITCHNAPQSSQTSDILLPPVKTCARCHRSNAAPGETCMLCHDYHHWKEQLEAQAVPESATRKSAGTERLASELRGGHIGLTHWKNHEPQRQWENGCGSYQAAFGCMGRNEAALARHQE